MEILLTYQEVEKLTGLEDIEYESKMEVSSNSGLFKKRIKIIRVYNNHIFLDFGFIWNLIINYKLEHNVRGDFVIIKIKKLNDFIKLNEIEATENGIKLRGEL